jgi:hypothetical protein
METVFSVRAGAGKIDLASSNLTRPGFGGIIKRDRLKSVAPSVVSPSCKRGITERSEVGCICSVLAIVPGARPLAGG